MNTAARTVNCNPPGGIDGKGICVAVLDTGISPIADFTRPDNRISCFVDFVNHRFQPYDDNGHGTHVTGCIASNGFLSGGLFKGIAPNCPLAVLKILDETGSGTAKWSFDAIKWIAENHRAYNIRIVNMSVGTTDRSIYKALSSAVQMLWQKGIVVCAAAGNDDPYTITSPGINSHIITAGCWEDHAMYRFKDRFYNYSKPDIFAPGKDIISCMSDTFSFSNERRSTEKIVMQHYIKMSGSSMSTPIVSGAAALLLQYNPLLTPSQVKEKIISASLSGKNKKLLNIKEMFV